MHNNELGKRENEEKCAFYGYWCCNVEVGGGGDAPTLSSQAVAALQEFLSEQNQLPAEQSEVALVTEDWRLSQFWYDRKTAETVTNEVLALCSCTHARVACIVCPTLYAYLKRIDPSVSVQLLEYDKRFEQYGIDFTFYDYNQPEELPTEMKHAFQVIVADPPYLSGECLEKVAQTISFLSQSNAYLLLLTGEVQNDRAAEPLGLHHAYSGLSIPASLGMSFAYSLTMIQGRDWEDGSKRNR